MRRAKKALIISLVPVIIYFLGPNPETPRFEGPLPEIPNELDNYIKHKELQHRLRPDNEARIVWADTLNHRKTAYSIVYLHGFSASQAEADPVHRNIAEKFGCNLFLSRLAHHGVDTTEQLLNLKAEDLWESAKEALAIGSRLGDTVIVMGTSTGGTLALMLAARFAEVHSLILLSPNIKIFDDNAWILNNPWGLQLARMITGSKYVYSSDTRPVYKQYWNYPYRLEAVTELQEMLEICMKPELFQKVHQPALMLYYYKNQTFQDSVVKVGAMKEMFTELATPSASKRAVAMPEAGDHVLGSYIKSKDVEGVQLQIEKFLTEVLKMKPVK